MAKPLFLHPKRENAVLGYNIPAKAENAQSDLI